MDRRRDHLTEQQQKLQSPRQANLQYVDDTWERLLNALERLEQSTEEFRHVAASRLDNHPDKGRITEDELGIRVEVHLQIQCLQKVVNPVREDVTWLIEDFLAWFGGREARPPAPVDEYAVPVLKCILGYRYDLPSLPPPPNLNRSDVLTAAEYLGIGMHASAKIEEGFKCGPEKMATRHFHQRGSITQGLTRLAKLPDRWGASLADQLSRELRTSAPFQKFSDYLG